MSLFDIIGEVRPRMDIPASKKDEDYDRRMTRADRSAIATGTILRMHAKAAAAERAYNDQVMTQADVDTFMLDDGMNVRNRTMFNFNMVKPHVEQLVGTVLQSDINFTVQSVTKQTRTKRQNAFAHMQVMHSLAEMSPEMNRIINGFYPLGKTMRETEGIFNNWWQDDSHRAMRHLLQRWAAIDEVDRWHGANMFQFVLTGMLFEIARIEGSHPRYQRVHPSEAFWDTTARQLDMADATFMGVMPRMGFARICETWNPSDDKVKAIQSALHMATGLGRSHLSMSQNTMMRVVSDYWTDIAYQEFGYVRVGDIPTLVRVGDSEEGYKSPISYNDLIDPPDTEEIQEAFKGKKTRKSYVECTRFCDMVLWEDMCGRNAKDSDRKRYDANELPDLVLDHGVYDLQGYNPFDISRARRPFAARMFAQANGDVVSPVQAILDPNRFVNRMMSAVEQQANESGGKGYGIDMDLIDPSIDEGEAGLRIKNGRVIPFKAGGRGINNAIQIYDNSIGQGVFNLLQIVNSVQDLIRTVTGVNSTFAGEAQKNQLVRVTDVLVQRGATMQEPVHSAYADFVEQKYRFIATAGKEFYLQRPDVLEDMVSEEDLFPLYQTRGFELDRFNADIVRDNADSNKRQAANMWLDQLFQLGCIDQKRYASLYNNSYIEDVAPAVRQYAAEIEQAKNEQQKQQVRDNMQRGLAAQEMALKTREDQVYGDQMSNAQTLAKVAGQEKANVTREQVKAELTPAAAPTLGVNA